MGSIALAIITAAVSAATTVAVTVFIQKLINQKKYPTHPSERSKRLIGRWKGHFEQPNPENQKELMSTDLTMKLENSGKIIIGEFQFKSAYDPDEVTAKITNGMFDGNILKMDYENEKKYVFQAGAATLKLDDRGKSLMGKFVGYSPTLNSIIAGTVHLKRLSD